MKLSTVHMMKYFTRLELKWAFIFFIASLLWMYFEKLMGWHDEKIAQHATMTFLFAIIAIGIFVLALREKRRKHYNNNMTWLQGFICGLMITFVVTILSPLAQYITAEVISPGYFSNIIDYAVNVEKKDRAEMESHFNLKSYIIQGMLGSFIMGLVTSAIVALFLKSKNVLPQE